jgi:hypothetical protein
MKADLTMPAVELDGALSHDDYYGELRCNRALVFYLQSYLGSHARRGRGCGTLCLISISWWARRGAQSALFWCCGQVRRGAAALFDGEGPFLESDHHQSRKRRICKINSHSFATVRESAMAAGDNLWLASGKDAMTVVLHDLLLFSCLAAFVTGIVIATATLII